MESRRLNIGQFLGNASRGELTLEAEYLAITAESRPGPGMQFPNESVSAPPSEERHDTAYV